MHWLIIWSTHSPDVPLFLQNHWSLLWKEYINEWLQCIKRKSVLILKKKAIKNGPKAESANTHGYQYNGSTRCLLYEPSPPTRIWYVFPIAVSQEPVFKIKEPEYMALKSLNTCRIFKAIQFQHKVSRFFFTSFTGDFPSQRPVTQNFDVFFDLCLNKWLSKHSMRRRWYETPSCPLWRHCNAATRILWDILWAGGLRTYLISHEHVQWVAIFWTINILTCTILHNPLRL